MKKIFLAISAFAILTGSHSQTAFHKFLPVADRDGFLYRTCQTSDGGFVSVGRVSDPATFDNDFLILKTDASGIASWIKKYSADESEEFTDVAETADGGVVAAGSSFNMNTFISKAVLKKFSSAGVSQWSRSYSMSGHSAGAKKVAKDASGNIYVLGAVAVDGSSDDYFIMKLDAGGNILAQHTFGTPDFDYPLAFLRKGNGDFFICGWNNTSTGENIHLLKINADMTVAWNKKISGTARYFAYDMRERSDGDIVLAGRYDDLVNSYDILICTLDDASGEQVWARSYSAAEGPGTYAYGLTITSGDAIAVTGPVETSVEGAFVLATDAAGNLNWSNRYGIPGFAGKGYGIAAADDGGYMVCGPLSNSSNAIVQLIKTNAEGDLPCNSVGYEILSGPLTLPMQSITVTAGNANLSAQEITLNETSYGSLETICTGTGIADIRDQAIKVSPNPTDGRFTVTTPGMYAGAKVIVVNAAGINVLDSNMPQGETANSVSKTFSIDIPAGLYLLSIGNGKQKAARKLFISK